MQEHEYKARDKTVQKMSRDGLREENLRSKKEKRITRREADEKKIARTQGTGAGFWEGKKSSYCRRTSRGRNRGKTQVTVKTRFSGTGKKCGSG